TPSRGARYNSAVRYAHGRKDCMIVVKSEDGMVSLFPELPPQIRRFDLQMALVKLRGLAASDTVDLGDLGEVMNWFDEHRFYLSPAMCDEVNRLWPRADSLLPADAWHFQFDPFVPDPDMNESYFLPG